jgi:hypothetical protein
MKTKKNASTEQTEFSPEKGTTAIIRDAVETFEKTKKPQSPGAQSRIISKLLNEKHKEDIVESALLKYYYSENV